jgi:cell division septal protein FtsQ
MGPANTRRRKESAGSWSELVPEIKPGVKWAVRGLQLLLLLIPVFIVYSFYSYGINSERFEIKLDIRGLEAVKKEIVVEALEPLILEEDGGKVSFFTISSREIRDQLQEKITRFKTVKVRRKFPDNLIVEVEERTPEAIVWFRRQGWLIDSEGVMFLPAKNEKNKLKDILPRVIGLDEARNQGEFQRIWKRALAVKEAVSAVFSPDILDQIKVMPAGYSVSIKINRPRSLEVLLGSGQYELKIKKLYELMNTNEFRQTGDYIDLSDPGKIYTGESNSSLIPEVDNRIPIG